MAQGCSRFTVSTGRSSPPVPRLNMFSRWWEDEFCNGHMWVSQQKVPPPPTKKKGGGQKNGKSNDVPSKPSMHGKSAHVYHSTSIQGTFVYDSLAILGPIHMFESRGFSFNETWANLPAMDDFCCVTNLPPSLPALPRC